VQWQVAGESVMTGGSSGLDPCMVVVGDPCSDLVRTVVRLAREWRVEIARCEDVYSAVAAAARAPDRRVLIVGTMREMAREQGRFFQIAGANGQRCCCLVDRDSAADPGPVLVAVRSGARLTADVQEVKAILEDWLAGGRPRPRHSDLSDLMEDDLRATEAELIALLGRPSDV